MTSLEPKHEDQDLRWRQLMSAAQGGDQRAYTLLLTEIVPVLRRVVRSHWRSGHDIEDIVQEVLLSAHSVRQTYDPSRPFLPWLLTICHRRIADASRARRRKLANEVEGATAPETFFDPAAKSEQAISDDQEQIRKALAELSPAQRESIELMKLRGLSLEEASASTGKSVGAMKVTVHRAMKALRQVLEGKG